MARGICNDLEEYRDGNVALLRIALSQEIYQNYAQSGRHREDVKTLINLKSHRTLSLYLGSSSAAPLIFALPRRELEGLEVGRAIVSANLLADADLNSYDLNSMIVSEAERK